jgi:hypothetical protein
VTRKKIRLAARKARMRIRGKGNDRGTRVAPRHCQQGDRLGQGEVPADCGRWIATGGLPIEKLAMTFSGERSHNAGRLRAICGLLVLPALVEAGFQEKPMARILVFSEVSGFFDRESKKSWVAGK